MVFFFWSVDSIPFRFSVWVYIMNECLKKMYFWLVILTNTDSNSFFICCNCWRFNLVKSICWTSGGGLADIFEFVLYYLIFVQVFWFIKFYVSFRLVTWLTAPSVFWHKNVAAFVRDVWQKWKIIKHIRLKLVMLNFAVCECVFFSSVVCSSSRWRFGKIA